MGGVKSELYPTKSLEKQRFGFGLARESVEGQISAQITIYLHIAGATH
jgi:hypothetical protein